MPGVFEVNGAVLIRTVIDDIILRTGCSRFVRSAHSGAHVRISVYYSCRSATTGSMRIDWRAGT